MSFELFEKLAERCPLLQEAGEGGSYKKAIEYVYLMGYYDSKQTVLDGLADRLKLALKDKNG